MNALENGFALECQKVCVKASHLDMLLASDRQAYQFLNLECGQTEAIVMRQNLDEGTAQEIQ